MKRKIKFGVFADLHVDIMHDAQERLSTFLDAARAADVDFIIHLGDFCYPDDNRVCVCPPEKMPPNIKNALKVKTYADKDETISMFNNFEKPSFHVLGNHECDMCSKKETLEFLGLKHDSYYSFDMGGFHFIVLDASFYKKDGQYIAFENGNYFAESYDFSNGNGEGERLLPWLPPEQINWLKEDLENAKLPSILFSHQCLGEENTYSILNAPLVKEVLKNAPCGVLAAFNGHEHMDYEMYQDGIWFVNINSISNNWLDVDFIVPNQYGTEIDEKYPNIKYTVPYKDPVYAIIDIDETGINIKGVQSDYVGPTPEERGLYKAGSWWLNVNGGKRPLTAAIRDRFLSFG